MKALFSLFILTASFSAAAYIDEPVGCMKNKAFPCAVRMTESSDHLQIQDARLYPTLATTLLLNSAESVRLLEGGIWILSAKNLKIEAGIADFKISGQAWLEKNSKGKVIAYNLNGDMEAVMINNSQNEPIPIGFQNWFDGFLNDKTINRGVISPIEPLHFLSKCIKVSGISKKEIAGQLKSYKRVWSDNIEQASQFYAQVVERRMASYQEKQDREYQNYLNRQREKQQLRNLYRNSFYNP